MKKIKKYTLLLAIYPFQNETWISNRGGNIFLSVTRAIWKGIPSRFHFGMGIACLMMMLQPLSAQNATPLAIAIYDPITIPQSPIVKGIRLNLLYGKHEYVSGIDIGLVSHTVYKNTGILIAAIQIGHKSSGFRTSLFNFVDEASGFQLGLVNLNKFANCPSLGILYNDATIKSSGPQLGLWNTTGESAGIQLGLINYASEVNGMQFGVINVADSMPAGIQFGVLNFSNNGFFPVVKL